MRGASHPHTWFADRLNTSLAGIKSHGANAVRVVLSSGGRWTRNSAADVSNVIAQCKANRLICMLEVHDTTGFGEEGAAISLDQAVDYWIDIQSALNGQENYVLINIGNEPYGNSGYQAWTAATANAISRMRAAGFDHTLVVDAPNWGQDWSFTMRDTAAQVYAADPTGKACSTLRPRCRPT
jgi:mannan endo-1,4-beta-mannosidase